MGKRGRKVRFRGGRAELLAWRAHMMKLRGREATVPKQALAGPGYKSLVHLRSLDWKVLRVCWYNRTKLLPGRPRWKDVLTKELA